MAEIKIEGAGAAIRSLRRKKGLSIRELAERLSWDRGRLSRYENDRLALSLNAIQQIAESLGEPPEALVLECLTVVHKDLGSSAIGRTLGAIVSEIRKHRGK